MKAVGGNSINDSVPLGGASIAYNISFTGCYGTKFIEVGHPFNVYNEDNNYNVSHIGKPCSIGWSRWCQRLPMEHKC